MAVTRDEIRWCYRNLLGREPESEEAVAAHAQSGSFKELVDAFSRSPEFLRRRRRTRNPADADAEAPLLAWDAAPAAPQAMKTIPIKDLPAACFADKKRAPSINGALSYPAAQEGRLGLLRIGYHGHADPAALEGVAIELGSLCELDIHIADSNSRLKIGRGVEGKWLFRLFRSPCVEIGDRATSNGADVFVDDGELRVGEDCMFANVFIHVGDNHALFDLATGERLNVRRARVCFEAHVWAASRATVLADSTVGAGSVIAANATVKGDVPRCALVAGTPARPVKRGISWTRSATGEEWRAVADSLARAGAL